MVLDKSPLSVVEGVRDGMELLRYFHAGLSVFDHLEDLGEVAVCASEPVRDFGVLGMFVFSNHSRILSPWRG